ncbi:MAG: NAD(P)H-dependent oxidoreductase subunit E [Spirochaetaceae bacterium]|nr:NAD(P)H-dependent oxidoreductase subunit E [Spirochaetaceae bacterium]
METAPKTALEGKAPSPQQPETILQDYPDRRDTLLSALHEIQRCGARKSWITDQEISLVAQHYHIPLAELDGVVSFYKMFAREKRGSHIIRLCDSLSCRVRGSLDLYHHVRNKLGISTGMTTQDGIFTLEIVNCLGACDKSPNLMVDNTLISGLTIDAVDALLDGILEAEQ